MKTVLVYPQYTDEIRRTIGIARLAGRLVVVARYMTMRVPDGWVYFRCPSPGDRRLVRLWGELPELVGRMHLALEGGEP